MRYVAFLRGINVGGKKLIKMPDLRRVLESLGLNNVRTFIASGNVLFETSQTNRDTLARKIEKKLLTAFGHDIPVVLQTIDELKNDTMIRYRTVPYVLRYDDMLCYALLG